MQDMTPETKARLRLQGKRIRMARAAAEISQTDLADLVSVHINQPVSREFIRRRENGELDVSYAILRAMATIMGPAISEETSTPLEWLAGGGDPVRVNPGYLNGRWREYVIPWSEVDLGDLSRVS